MEIIGWVPAMRAIAALLGSVADGHRLRPNFTTHQHSVAHAASRPLCLAHAVPHTHSHTRTTPPCCRLVADDDPWADNASFLAEVMVATYEHRHSQVCRGGEWHTHRVCWAGGDTGLPAVGAQGRGRWRAQGGCTHVQRGLTLLSDIPPPSGLDTTLHTCPTAAACQADTINEMPLYPTEAVLFDEHQVPTVHYTGGCRNHWTGWCW
jgi:hypothetical protein